MSTEEEYLNEMTMDLQASTDRLREERNVLQAELMALKISYAEALDIIKEKNSVIDRLRIHLQQGVEL
jgi:hypothetical protein